MIAKVGLVYNITYDSINKVAHFLITHFGLSCFVDGDVFVLLFMLLLFISIFYDIII